MYTYLAGHVGCNSNTVGAFRALKQGYVSWASCRLEKIEVNNNRPDCHVRSAVKASMKNTTYTVYLLLHHTVRLTSVLRAICPSAAGGVILSPCAKCVVSLPPPPPPPLPSHAPPSLPPSRPPSLSLSLPNYADNQQAGFARLHYFTLLLT